MIMTEERAFELIVASLGKLKESKMLESDVELNTETILLGVGSPLDSIGFVTFVTDLEDLISSEAKEDLYLVLNEIDEFNINKPHLCLGALAKYCVKLSGG
jgi:acyl carrier protein